MADEKTFDWCQIHTCKSFGGEIASDRRTVMANDGFEKIDKIV